MISYAERIKKEVNLYRAYVKWKKKRSIFIHVPKVAGTSINHSLYGRTLGHYSAIELKTKFPILYSQSFVFGFVRNPWARALSAYRFAIKGKTADMGISNPGHYKIESFKSFSSFVLDWLPEQNLEKVDFVFRPQTFFLCDSQKNVIVDFVGRLENLQYDCGVIEKKIGANLNLKKMNSISLGRSYQEYYKTDKMIETISELYKDDISCFGYEFDNNGEAA
ncbi:sulfotransferase family 2 domain-containing protein [bacterium]|nr:sulfotransferase family 2 domain-containing protein [bacterium]